MLLGQQKKQFVSSIFFSTHFFKHSKDYFKSEQDSKLGNLFQLRKWFLNPIIIDIFVWSKRKFCLNIKNFLLPYRRKDVYQKCLTEDKFWFRENLLIRKYFYSLLYVLLIELQITSYAKSSLSRGSVSIDLNYKAKNRQLLITIT